LLFVIDVEICGDVMEFSMSSQRSSKSLSRQRPQRRDGLRTRTRMSQLNGKRPRKMTRMTRSYGGHERGVLSNLLGRLAAYVDMWKMTKSLLRVQFADYASTPDVMVL
jgi:hypothetical protein